MFQRLCSNLIFFLGFFFFLFLPSYANETMCQSSSTFLKKTPPVTTFSACSSWSCSSGRRLWLILHNRRRTQTFNTDLSVHMASTSSLNGGHTLRNEPPRPNVDPFLVISLREPVGGLIASILMQLISIRSSTSSSDPHCTGNVLPQ